MKGHSNIISFLVITQNQFIVNEFEYIFLIIFKIKVIFFCRVSSQFGTSICLHKEKDSWMKWSKMIPPGTQCFQYIMMI